MELWLHIITTFEYLLTNNNFFAKKKNTKLLYKFSLQNLYETKKFFFLFYLFFFFYEMISFLNWRYHFAIVFEKKSYILFFLKYCFIKFVFINE